MHVDQARADDHARGIDEFGILVGRPADCRDLAIDDRQIRNSVQALCRVYEPAPFNMQMSGRGVDLTTIEA